MVAEPALRRVALVVHPTRRIDGALATLTGWAADHGVDVVQLAVDGTRLREVRRQVRSRRAIWSSPSAATARCSASLRAAAPQGAPVLGVACGSLGALTAVAADDISEALDSVRAGAWRARSLPALAIGPEDAPDDWAANDFVVVRRGAGQLVADVVVDDELYGAWPATGWWWPPRWARAPTRWRRAARCWRPGRPPSSARRSPCTAAARRRSWSGRRRGDIDVHPGFAGFDVEVDGREREGRSAASVWPCIATSSRWSRSRRRAVAWRACASGG